MFNVDQIGYTFGANDSRFYIAYNEHRADTTERILLTKISELC